MPHLWNTHDTNEKEAYFVARGKSIPKSKMWYEKAAEKGDIAAMRKLWEKRSNEYWKKYITQDECLKWGKMAIEAGCKDINLK